MTDTRDQALERVAGGAATAPPLTLVQMAAHLAGAMRDAGTDLLYGVPGGGEGGRQIGRAECRGRVLPRG